MRLELKTAPASSAVQRDEVKTQRYINNTDKEDQQIDLLLESCTKELESFLGRKLINQSWYIYFDRPEYYDRLKADKNSLVLSTLNVSSITEVLKYQRDNSSSAITSSNYRLSGGANSSICRMVFNDDNPPTYENLRLVDAVRIEVVAGYGADREDIPEPIRSALRQLVAHRVEFPNLVSRESVSKIMMNVGPEIMQYRSVENWF